MDNWVCFIAIIFCFDIANNVMAGKKAAKLQNPSKVQKSGNKPRVTKELSLLQKSYREAGIRFNRKLENLKSKEFIGLIRIMHEKHIGVVQQIKARHGGVVQMWKDKYESSEALRHEVGVHNYVRILVEQLHWVYVQMQPSIIEKLKDLEQLDTLPPKVKSYIDSLPHQKDKDQATRSFNYRYGLSYLLLHNSNATEIVHLKEELKKEFGEHIYTEKMAAVLMAELFIQMSGPMHVKGMKNFQLEQKLRWNTEDEVVNSLKRWNRNTIDEKLLKLVRVLYRTR